jgi:hypothetical protein
LVKIQPLKPFKNMKTQLTNELEEDVKALETLTKEEAKQFNELMDRVLSTLPANLSEWRLK